MKGSTPYIVKGIGGFYYVQTEQGIVECKAKGIFRKNKISPVAGDFVRLEQDAHSAVIAEILPRKNLFVRPPIANVDLFFIVASTIEPTPSTLVIDKLSAIAVHKEAQPVLVITKTDLYQPDFLREIYEKAGFPVLCVNAATGEGLDRLLELLRDKVSVFCGNSGVGKSTLLSALIPQQELATGEISKKLGRGRHTTRHSQLIPLGEETYLMDTPGFTSFYVEDMEKEELRHCFPEFAPYEGECRFQGCTHTHEPGCKVKEALQEGKISSRRYENYQEIYKELEEKRRY